MAPDRTALIADLASRRPDTAHADAAQLRTLTPFAARLHRIAAFITEHQLPDAEILLIEGSVIVEVHDGPIENTIRRWAAALELLVTTTPCDMHDGTAGTQWNASGWDGTGTFWQVIGKQALLAVTQ